MQEIETVTGLGYFKDQAGRIISKADLPPGKHIVKDGFVFIEVGNRDELDHVEIYKDPADILQQSQDAMIAEKTRELAIIELKKEGKLPPDFEDI